MGNRDVINSMNIGELIKLYRKKAGLTQKDLSNKLNYKDNHIISLYETGKKSPQIKVLVDIANVLNIDLSYLKLDNLSLGEKVRYLREYNGYTQLAFSKKVRISNAELSKIEKNILIPTNDMINKISQGLEMSRDELINFSLNAKNNQKVDVYTGEKIRYYRIKANLTQKELAEKVGISESYISLFEVNKRYPKNNILLKIAKALNQDISIFNWYLF